MKGLSVDIFEHVIIENKHLNLPGKQNGTNWKQSQKRFNLKIVILFIPTCSLQLFLIKMAKRTIGILMIFVWLWIRLLCFEKHANLQIRSSSFQLVQIKSKQDSKYLLFKYFKNKTLYTIPHSYIQILNCPKNFALNNLKKPLNTFSIIIKFKKTSWKSLE